MSKYTKKETGAAGEEYTVKFLKRNKYKILERNYRKKYGEIDIVAENKNYLVFVEVKTRHENPMVLPYEAVDLRKQRRIIKTAYAYLLENPTEKFCRFDVSEVYVNSTTMKVLKINYIENAFEEESSL